MQIALLAALRATPEPEAVLPGARAVAPLHAPPTPTAIGSDVVAVEVLQQLLATRVRAAAARQARPAASYLPPTAMVEAARSEPDPDGPAVQALVEHYSVSLAALGETLDATSSPGTGALPRTPDPAAVSPDAPTPVAP
jgi:hypothetical protein